MTRLDRQTLGKLGEDLACRELERQGYEIIARRYRTRLGEIDIVAHDSGTVVFVEVKTRIGVAYGTPGEAVTWRKRQKLWALAASYLVQYGLTRLPCRFDVVSIQMDDAVSPKIELLRDAFGGGAMRQ